MKKTLGLLMLLAASTLTADSFPAIVGASSGGTIGPAVGYAQTDGYKFCGAQAWTSDGASAVVNVETSSLSTGPWQVAAAMTLNGTPSDNSYYVGPCPAFLRINAVTISGGTVNARYEARRSGPPPDIWQTIGNFWQRMDGGNAAPAGTVLSVGLSLPAQFSVTNSPVTSSGTLTGVWASQNQNLGFFSPDNASGVPTFRAVVPRDLGATAATGLCLKGSSATTMDWQTCSSTSAYATVQDEGGALTQRSTINFIGAGVTCADNSGSTRTDCTIPGGSSGPLLGATDAVNTSPVRGGIVVANSTPKWAQVAIGSSNTVLTSNGTDPSWASVTGSMLSSNTVTLGKIAVAGGNSKWLGSGASGTGATYTENSFGTGLAVSGTTVNAVKPVKTFTLENPGAAENMTMFYFPNAVTITEVRCVVKGSSPSVTANVAYGTDRSAAGTNVTTSPSACTNTTSGATATLNNTAVSAGSYMWLTTSAQSGTVTDINISVSFTEP